MLKYFLEWLRDFVASCSWPCRIFKKDLPLIWDAASWCHFLFTKVVHLIWILITMVLFTPALPWVYLYTKESNFLLLKRLLSYFLLTEVWLVNLLYALFYVWFESKHWEQDHFESKLCPYVTLLFFKNSKALWLFLSDFLVSQLEFGLCPIKFLQNNSGFCSSHWHN